MDLNKLKTNIDKILKKYYPLKISISKINNLSHFLDYIY